MHCIDGGVRDVRSILEQVVCKACILQETGGDEALLYPLKKGDLRLVRGVAVLLQDGRRVRML